MKKKLKKTIYLLSIVGLLSCSGGPADAPTWKEGDLLFQDLNCGPLCDAIESVTEGRGGAEFSHVGLILKYDSNWTVAEANAQGVVLTPLETFIDRSVDEKGRPRIMQMRWSDMDNEHLRKLKSFILSRKGRAYDHAYTMNSEQLYCAELLLHAFQYAFPQDSTFQTEPMTFRQPGSSKIYPAWIKHYERLNQSVPEGEPGVNPAAMSRHPRLELVDVWGTIDGYAP